MIQVKVTYKNRLIKQVIISGHALAADHGEDLVCAGVSSIAVGTLNALDKLTHDNVQEQMREGYVEINVTHDEHDVQLLVSMMIIQLETLAIAHPQNINIKKQEV